MNAIESGGVTRHFQLFVPSDPGPGELFPTVFAWHGTGGNGDNVIEQLDLSNASASQRFIVVVPESERDIYVVIGDVRTIPPWPTLSSGIPEEYFEREYEFFDDMLACVSEQFPVNKECVSASGISAGALYAAQLASSRSSYLASLLSISGGVHGAEQMEFSLLRPWVPAEHRLAALVLWGGVDDFYAFTDFGTASNSLVTDLAANGHFLVECIHNCGHGSWEPVTEDGKWPDMSFLWSFLKSHPYWLPDGKSPLSDCDTLPSVYPDWCGIGPDSAVPKSTSCD